MLNKISLRRIKSFLSLRGAKRRSNLNISGFSLIELMVAVVILALAIFGIFHAYSVGFMGMADARDRTVATNYAREAMEDIKNMDFELITNENLSTAEIIDGKYNRVTTIIDEDSNLKKITTRVYWNNRNGKTINIVTTMYVNKTQLNPGVASKIILYANPYYTVLPSVDETVNLIAVIKDVNGNTKIDWSGENICFSILSGSKLGYLPAGANGGVTTNNGVANTIFTPSNYTIDGVVQQGDVLIEASVKLPDGSTISDTITITVTLDVVRIELSANPTIIEANGTTTSTITAALKNSGNSTVTNAKNNITFNISGEGIFVDSEGLSLPNTVTLTPPNEPGGIATIYVKPIADTPGVAIVTASSEGLLSDFVHIITTGDPYSISVSVDPVLIYTDNTVGTKVNVTIKDINGNPVNYTGTINLSTSGGTGVFGQDTDCDPIIPSDSLCFDNVSWKSTTFSSTSPGTIRITAIGDGLISGNADIEVKSALIADNISLTANPENILAGGENVSEITATIRQGTTVISTYNSNITFEIIQDTSGSATFYESGNTSVMLTGNNYGNDGEAEVHLIPGSSIGTAEIKVSTTNSKGTLIEEIVEVRFYSNAHHIELIASPQSMLVNGDTCTMTATIVDGSGTKVENYNEDITFTILEGWPSNAKFFLTTTSTLIQTVENGEISVDLTPQKKAGTVKIEATSFT